VNNRRFGSCPRTVLSMNKDFGSAEKWKSWVRISSDSI
jgi:hypothetical protein